MIRKLNSWNICFFLLFIIGLCPNQLIADCSNEEVLREWKGIEILECTERKPARTAVLIIAPPGEMNSSTDHRWRLGKQTWEQYMNSHPNVDCYFLQCTVPDPMRASSDQVWIKGNTIYVGDPWQIKYNWADRILYKTVAAIEFLLPNYTHFIRTNLNVILNLKSVNEYMETHHQSFYTSPICEHWYTIGYGIIFTADVAAHIASEYRRLEKEASKFIHHEVIPDDGALTSLATGVYPAEHPFRRCPSLPYGVRQHMCSQSLESKRICEYGALIIPPISFEEAIKICDQVPDTMMLYRIKCELSLLNLNELAEIHNFLLRKHYPELKCIDLVSYAKSILN